MNPELRDLKAGWISYPPVPHTNDPNNLFEIEVTHGNGTKSRITLTRMQAKEVARAIKALKGEGVTE